VCERIKKYIKVGIVMRHVFGLILGFLLLSSSGTAASGLFHEVGRSGFSTGIEYGMSPNNVNSSVIGGTLSLNGMLDLSVGYAQLDYTVETYHSYVFGATGYLLRHTPKQPLSIGIGVTYQPSFISMDVFYAYWNDDELDLEEGKLDLDALSVGLLLSYAFVSHPEYQVLGVLTGQRVFLTEKYQSLLYDGSSTTESWAGSLGLYFTHKVTDGGKFTFGGKVAAVEDQKSSLGFTGAWTWLL
jgi:hypothetical protein